MMRADAKVPMIPRLPPDGARDALAAAFVEALRQQGFGGDISLGSADRTVFSTDNSIYQREPAGILFPRETADLAVIARALGDVRFRSVVIAARGGGTGTNGQSLTSGFVVDLSRHMNRILAIDPAARRVRVQAGVVKDQLNAALRPHGLFFAPELSTSNRATIGGMIATDACGQGSCLYGKTRDHVAGLTTVLAGGTVWTSRPLGPEELERAKAEPGVVGAVHRRLDEVAREHAAAIEAVFLPLNRSLTGYDLPHLRDAAGRFDLNAVLCGSEGTLGLIAEAELAVLPIPARSALVNIRYRSFDAALRDARHLAPLRPASIETVDGTVLSLARSDVVWGAVEPYFPLDEAGPAAAILIVEILGDQDAEIETGIARMIAVLEDGQAAAGRLGWTQALSPEAVEAIWTMRKRAVGLLGNVQGKARPVAFVEDTAVPPERLADYIAEFRALLDRHGLRYGMFGHVDAGVVHVRPALDLIDPAQEPLVRGITDAVVELTRRHGGVLWGEHGKGLRSAYAPTFFGPIYPVLQTIKAAFDPFDQFNPGKVVAPPQSALTALDAVPFRAESDRQASAPSRERFGDAFHCNGNGACHDFDLDHVMCPSWKGTRERRHSPKGRSALMREWLRRLSAAGVEPVAAAASLRRGALAALPSRIANSWRKRRGEADFSHEVLEAMNGCLACKGCSGTCPVKVDVPDFRAAFLELYHGRYLRRPRDYLVASIERAAPWLARMPGLSRWMMSRPLSIRLARALGLVGVPLPARVPIGRRLRQRQVEIADPAALARLGPEERARSVVLVQDAFTRYFEGEVVLDTVDLLRALGFRVWLAPYLPNGKPQHVHGFLGPFERIARRTAGKLSALADAGVDLVGIDPSMTLVYRSEYRKALGGKAAPPVALLQEWLARRAALFARPAVGAASFRLFPHCTERALANGSMADWRTVFAALGSDLSVLEAGCCGMAGTFGHQAETRALSETIYRLSWAEKVEAFAADGLLATGYSCRSQIAAIDGHAIRHPVSALLDLVRAGQVGVRSDRTSI